MEGRLEITDDSGEVTGYQYCAADADIYVKTAYHYQDSFPLSHSVKSYTGDYKKGYYLKVKDQTFRLGQKRGSLSGVRCGDERAPADPGHFLFTALSLGVIETREYETKTVSYSKQGAYNQAQERLNKFLSKIQEKGVQIFENNVTIETDSKNCIADGNIILIQKIGKRVERTTDET